MIDDLFVFADVQAPIQRLLPVFFGESFFNLLFYFRLLGIALIFVFLILIIFFYIKVKKVKKPKLSKIGLSSLDQEALLNNKNLQILYKKIDDYFIFDNILYWKLILAEIDSFLNKALLEIGFKGNNFYEKLCKAKDYIEMDVDLINKTHEKVSNILDDNNYLLTKEETQDILKIYKQTIEELRKL